MCRAPHKLIIHFGVNDFDCLQFASQTRYEKSEEWKLKGTTFLIRSINLDPFHPILSEL